MSLYVSLHPHLLFDGLLLIYTGQNAVNTFIMQQTKKCRRNTNHWTFPHQYLLWYFLSTSSLSVPPLLPSPLLHIPVHVEPV